MSSRQNSASVEVEGAVIIVPEDDAELDEREEAVAVAERKEE